MKKKGFTLIELLAVIVILAIIALIATPLVLKYIEKSRQESKVDSAYSFVRNLETEIANYSIKHNGKKYNGQPSDKGYYELDNFNGSEIDTTVKGDKPDTIKVCLSSLGQVEKAMFEYGNYYVSYDGKKGSISDEATYSSFSCKTVVGGGTGNGNGGSGGESGNGGSDSVEVARLRLTIESDETSTGELTLTDEQKFTFKTRKVYCVDLINVDTNLKEIDNMCSGVFSEYMMNMYDDNDDVYIIGVEDTMFLFFSASGEYAGNYEVVIKETSDEFKPNSLRIARRGTNWLYSVDFVEGPAHVVITDEDNIIYCNKNITFSCEAGLCGEYSYDNDNLGNLDNVYNAIAEGKIITVKVTQTINGEEVVTSFSELIPTYIKTADDNDEYYIIGNITMPHGE